VRNALTIDVEDYFHVNAFRHSISQQDWDTFPLRVVGNTLKILDWLDELQTKGTFFVLGWVAERAPDLVREIGRRGHEIACHSYNHQLVYELGPEPFRQDLRRARDVLQEIGGKKVVGFRAPSYSITARSLWALDILMEEGFSYDSSIFPIYHDVYGMPGAERFPHAIRRPAGTILEFPISTLNIGMFGRNLRLPVGGGGYLRLLPVSFFRFAFKHINEREQRPAVLYFHPWEIDAGQPRIKAALASRFRHYVNLGKTFGKLDDLVSGLSFGPMGEILLESIPEQAPHRRNRRRPSVSKGSSPRVNWRGAAR
jgi:polysaccharide deacetylase family protein (PEP-CTERM system associated)